MLLLQRNKVICYLLFNVLHSSGKIEWSILTVPSLYLPRKVITTNILLFHHHHHTVGRLLLDKDLPFELYKDRFDFIHRILTIFTKSLAHHMGDLPMLCFLLHNCHSFLPERPSVLRPMCLAH